MSFKNPMSHEKKAVEICNLLGVDAPGRAFRSLVHLTNDIESDARTKTYSRFGHSLEELMDHLPKALYDLSGRLNYSVEQNTAILVTALFGETVSKLEKIIESVVSIDEDIHSLDIDVVVKSGIRQSISKNITRPISDLIDHVQKTGSYSLVVKKAQKSGVH